MAAIFRAGFAQTGLTLLVLVRTAYRENTVNLQVPRISRGPIFLPAFDLLRWMGRSRYRFPPVARPSEETLTGAESGSLRLTARRKANRNKQRYQAEGQELQDITRQISDCNYGSRHSRQLHKDRTNR